MSKVSTKVVTWLILLTALLALMAGCGKKEEIEKVVLSDTVSPDGLQRVTTFIDKYNGFDYTFTKAQEHVDEGKESLLILPQSPEREALFAGADYVVRRRV